MLPVAENVPAPGSYSSALAWDESPDWPPTSSARPSSRSVAVEPPPQSDVRVPAGSNVRTRRIEEVGCAPGRDEHLPRLRAAAGNDARQRRPYRRASSPCSGCCADSTRPTRVTAASTTNVFRPSARRKQARTHGSLLSRGGGFDVPRAASVGMTRLKNTPAGSTSTNIAGHRPSGGDHSTDDEPRANMCS